MESITDLILNLFFGEGEGDDGGGGGLALQGEYFIEYLKMVKYGRLFKAFLLL